MLSTLFSHIITFIKNISFLKNFAKRIPQPSPFMGMREQMEYSESAPSTVTGYTRNEIEAMSSEPLQSMHVFSGERVFKEANLLNSESSTIFREAIVIAPEKMSYDSMGEGDEDSPLFVSDSETDNVEVRTETIIELPGTIFVPKATRKPRKKMMIVKKQPVKAKKTVPATKTKTKTVAVKKSQPRKKKAIPPEAQGFGF